MQEKGRALEEWLSAKALPVLTGHSPKSNRKAVEVGRERGLPYVVGIAPQTAQQWEDPSALVEEALKLAEGAVAVGEIGLDNHWAKEEEERERQRAAFEAQLRWAKEKGKVVVIHSRKAIEEVVEMINAHFRGKVLFHFFSENVKALEGLKEGIEAYISIVGLPSKERKKAISSTPLSRLVVETDGPYVVRSPKGLWEAVSYIARVKGLAPEEVAEAVGRNALSLYAIEGI